MSEERKLVTILFADVTGSTALGEGLDPEDLRAIMGRYYDHARRLIIEHGGTLEKFIGDAVMAVFGLLQAHSNDAERALAAALALRDAIATDSVLGSQMALRMGVNTGLVMATRDVSRGDFLVTGDAVNVAARLEQHASPGEILVSQRTAQAAEAAFLFGPARSIEAKGKSLPLTAFPLSAPRPRRQLGHPPLVGRARDLSQLGLLYDRALRELRPQLVSVVAPAGAGKTRLLEEFITHLFEEDGTLVATARCLPYGQTLTYWPLRGLLEEMLGSDVTEEAVTGAFLTATYLEEDARRLAALVLTALGGESEGQVERESLFTAWRLLIEALARQAPRILVFEDLHWASESLLDLVEHIMQPRGSSALLVIATSRPDLLDRRPGWGGGRRNFTALTLEPLSERDTRMLVSALTEESTEVIRAKIVERSGGNPFFAIELARGLQGDATPENLPDTVQQAVQERLDALAPRERAVLQAAAVAGRAFRPGTLEAALGSGGGPRAPAVEVEIALDGLLARDLITAEEGGVYTFRHLLIRDVAYNALSRAERVRLHLIVAQWLENVAEGRVDEFVELIAYHYSQAAQIARLSAISLGTPVDTSRAIEYLERAATQAFHAGALIEARGHLERALQLARSAERRRLYEELGDRSGVLSHQALVAYRDALALWRAEDEPSPSDGARLLRKLVVSVMRWHGGMAPEIAQRAEMTAWRDEAQHLAELSGDENERWRLRAAGLFWYWWSGESPADDVAALMAEGWLAADYFEARGEWDAFSEALDGYGTLAFMTGDWTATFKASERRLAAPSLTLYERIDALNTVIWAQSNSGDYAGAIATVRGLLARRRTGELATAFVSAVFSARQCAFVSGEWDAFAYFDTVLQEAWEEADRRPDDPSSVRMWQGDTLYALLIALARDDRPAVERAVETLVQLGELESRKARREALQLWIEAGLQDTPAPLARALAPVANQDDLDLLPSHSSLCRFLSEHGQAAPERVLDVIAGGGAIRLEDALQRWYQIARALADDDNAALAGAIDEAEAHALIPHAARMRIVLAQRTGDRAQLERARPILERLGDKQYLRKLEAAAEALSQGDA
ncbi:MAG TPA: adenylate/guanylate cyclase domain-containing protein [Ktedonobacterales bacterium]